MTTTPDRTAGPNALGPRLADGVADYLPRIESASRHVREADDFRDLAHQARNALIVEAIDAGVSQRAAARAAGIAQSRVIRLLSRSQDDEELDG